MLSGEITSAGCIFLPGTDVTPLHTVPIHSSWHPLHQKHLSSSSPAECLICCRGSAQASPAPKMLPSMLACTSSLRPRAPCTSLWLCTLLHHLGVSTVLSAQSIVPKTVLQHGSLPLPYFRPHPASRINITNFYSSSWTNVHEPPTGLNVNWIPKRILGLHSCGTRILTGETPGENGLAVLWQDTVLPSERLIGNEDKSQLSGDWVWYRFLKLYIKHLILEE